MNKRKRYRHQKLIAGQPNMDGSNHLPPYGALRYDGERVQCHICGEWFIFLGSHIVKKHEWTADDYREEYGLNVTQPLCTPELSDKFMRRMRFPIAAHGFSKDNPPPQPPRQRAAFRAQAKSTQTLSHKDQQFTAEALAIFIKNLQHTQSVQPCALCGNLVLGCKKHTHLCQGCRKPWRALLQRERRKRKRITV